jgi:hypothetical protein
LNFIEFTDQLILVEAPLAPHFLVVNAQHSAVAFIAAGTATNTVRSYCSALAYWSAWL